MPHPLLSQPQMEGAASFPCPNLAVAAHVPHKWSHSRRYFSDPILSPFSFRASLTDLSSAHPPWRLHPHLRAFAQAGPFACHALPSGTCVAHPPASSLSAHVKPPLPAASNLITCPPAPASPLPFVFSATTPHNLLHSSPPHAVF